MFISNLKCVLKLENLNYVSITLGSIATPSFKNSGLNLYSTISSIILNFS